MILRELVLWSAVAFFLVGGSLIFLAVMDRGNRQISELGDDD
jgi:hypothetical protein